MTNLEQKIEAVLFWKNEPMHIEQLAKILDVEVDSINSALKNIAESYSSKGIVLIKNSEEVSLGTNPTQSELIEKLQKDELNKSLSKASLEVLSIILYKNGATRADIDYIRGVNSTFTLRALSSRGLVEKVVDENDNRKYLWKPTTQLLSFMGLSNIDSLPEYDTINRHIEQAMDSIERNKLDENNDGRN